MTTTTAEVSEIRKYELMAIFSGELAEKDFANSLSELRKFLQENTKGISYEDNWGKRDFTFRIKRQPRGYYAIFDFSAVPQQIAELTANIKLNQQVLRHLLISLPENYQSGQYKETALTEKIMQTEETKKKKYGKPKELLREPPASGARSEPSFAGKEDEEKLKTVEKKLEKILENPDIDIS